MAVMVLFAPLQGLTPPSASPQPAHDPGSTPFGEAGAAHEGSMATPQGPNGLTIYWIGWAAAPRLGEADTPGPAALGPRRPRPRGRGGKGYIDIVTVNTSGQPQLHAALQHEIISPVRQQGESRKNRVAAVACQEHHARLHGWVDLQHRARSHGWIAHGAEATSTDAGGASAGVLVATPAHLGSAPPFGGLQDDFSPKDSPGRLAATWLHTAIPGGLLVIAVYFWTGEGLSRRNLRLLEAAGALARRHGGLWIICADFNFEPMQLKPYSDWMDNMRAVVAAPNAPTHHPADGGEPRVLDYFLVDARLAPAVREVEVLNDVPINPHRAVRLTLAVKAANYLVQVPKKQVALPKVPQIGCGRRPPTCDLSAVVPRGPLEQGRESFGTTGQRPQPSRSSPEDVASAAWKTLVGAIEQELCARCDLVDGQGKALQRYTGRGQPLRMVWRPVLPPRSAGLGAAPAVAVAATWAFTRILELAYISRRVLDGQPTPAQRRQWMAIHSRFTRHTGHVATLMRKDPQTWGPRCDLVAEHRIGGDDWCILEYMAHEIMDEARNAKIAASRDAAKAWKAWVAAELKKGAGALHAYTKREALPALRQFLQKGVPTASPQQLVQHERSKWKEVWRHSPDSDEAPWRTDPHGDDDEMPAIDGTDVLAAAGEMSVWTGVGVDWIPPRAYSWLSIDTLNQVAKFYLLVESLARWPGAVAHILMHLIGKKVGGTRPIGVLASIVRIWERLRRPVCWAWRQRNHRLYTCAAVGRTAEAAV